MKPEMERRVVPAQSAHKLRAMGDKSMRIGGYAAVFNALSQDLGGFKERILPGAFARCLRSADVVCLFNHDPNQVLGRSTAGTLTLKEDGEGLYFECELPNTSVWRDCSEMVSRGDIRGCSFAFESHPLRHIIE
jgi:HK97 family phage prohead protease